MNRYEFNKLIERLEKREDLMKWVKTNEFSPYFLTKNTGEIIIAYHGTFSDEPVNKIKPNLSSDNVHGGKGMYFSSSVDEVNKYYTNFKNDEADVHSSLDEIKSYPETLVRRFELIKYLGEDFDIYDFFEVEDVINYCLEKLNDDDFLKIFKINKESAFNMNSDEIIESAYIRNQGVVYPVIIRTENPCYLIEPINANNKGLKSTKLKIPLMDVYDDPIFIDEIKKESFIDFNKFLKKINMNKDQESELINTLENFSVIDKEGLIDYLKEYICSLNIDEDFEYEIIEKLEFVFEEDYYYFGDEKEYLNLENNYLKLIEEIGDEYKDLVENKIMEIHDESMEFNIYTLYKELFEDMLDNPELRGSLDSALFSVFDCLVYDANNEFSYVRENCFEDGDQIFHFVLRDSKNVKYAFNETFSHEEEMMYKKVIEERRGKNISINEIRRVEERFKRKYTDFPDIRIHDYSNENVAYIDKNKNEIGVYRNQIKSKEELIKAIYHEYIIHGGIKKYLQENEDKSFLLSVYNACKDRDDFKNIKSKYVKEKTNLELKEKELIAEEYIAFCAENKLYKKNKMIKGIFEKLSLIISKFKKKFSIEKTNDRISILIHDIEKEKRRKRRSI